MDTFISPTWVSKDTATNFKNAGKFINTLDRSWDSSWSNLPGGAKIGYTVQARIQQRFTVSEGQALVQQPIQNQTVPITINHQYHTDMGWSSSQSALEVEMVQERYTKPAGAAIAGKWDVTAGAELYKQIYFSAGVPGAGPVTSNQTWTDTVALLQEQDVPDEYIATITPRQQSALTNANFALFQPKNEYFRTGEFAVEALGVNSWRWDNNLPTHTTGTFTTSSPAVNGSGLTGSTLATDGWGTYALKAGDVFTIDGVYSVVPTTYVSTGVLQQFVMSSDLSGSTTATLAFSPSIITSGQLQTVVSAPADNAAITFLGATGSVSATMAATRSKQNFVYHKSAFAFVMADLPDVGGAGALCKRIQSKVSGLSMRYVEQYNISTDQLPTRIDTIGGVAVVLPYFAARVWN